MRNKEEIIKALTIIKEVCNENGCSVCPFSDGRGGCVIQDLSPIKWNIRTSEEVWRAFYN